MFLFCMIVFSFFVSFFWENIDKRSTDLGVAHIAEKSAAIADRDEAVARQLVRGERRTTGTLRHGQGLHGAGDEATGTVWRSAVMVDGQQGSAGGDTVVAGQQAALQALCHLGELKVGCFFAQPVLLEKVLRQNQSAVPEKVQHVAEENSIPVFFHAQKTKDKWLHYLIQIEKEA